MGRKPKPKPITQEEWRLGLRDAIPLKPVYGPEPPPRPLGERPLDLRFTFNIEAAMFLMGRLRSGQPIAPPLSMKWTPDALAMLGGACYRLLCEHFEADRKASLPPDDDEQDSENDCFFDAIKQAITQCGFLTFQHVLGTYHDKYHEQVTFRVVPRERAFWAAEVKFIEKINGRWF